MPCCWRTVFNMILLLIGDMTYAKEQQSCLSSASVLM